MRLCATRRLLLAETIRDYVHRLKKQGIKQIGYGEYGLVFQHPTLPDVVVKLLVESDPDYLSWVRFSIRNQDNPYVPQIFSVSRGKNIFDPEMFEHFGSSFGSNNLRDMHLVFMEKLKPVTSEEYRKFGARMSELANEVVGRETFRWSDVRDNFHLWDILSQQKRDLKLAKVARFIHKGPSEEGLLDLHDQNIMKRGRQVVIVDPFAS